MVKFVMRGEGPMVRELGYRATQIRLAQNMTQKETAEKAGVSKRTLERFEHGESIQLNSFIRILTILGLLEKLQALIPVQEVSPMDMITSKKQKSRKRAYKRSEATDSYAAEPWVWGDE